MTGEKTIRLRFLKLIEIESSHHLGYRSVYLFQHLKPGPLDRDSLRSGQSALVANKEINDDRKVPNHIHRDRQHGKAMVLELLKHGYPVRV